jgi:hypothetical protein
MSKESVDGLKLYDNSWPIQLSQATFFVVWLSLSAWLGKRRIGILVHDGAAEYTIVTNLSPE